MNSLPDPGIVIGPAKPVNGEPITPIPDWSSIKRGVAILKEAV